MPWSWAAARPAAISVSLTFANLEPINQLAATDRGGASRGVSRCAGRINSARIWSEGVLTMAGYHLAAALPAIR